jgi:hypothetical protein
MRPAPRLLFCGLQAHRQIERIFKTPGFGGYVLKQAIGDSIGWAAALCASGYTVLTPGMQMRVPVQFERPANLLSIRGTNWHAQFSENQYRAARMAFVLSMERRDMADELGITPGTCHGVISGLYKDLELDAFMAGIESGKLPAKYGRTHPAIRRSLEDVLGLLQEAKLEGSKKQNAYKAPDKETLSFHLMTIPEIA